MTRSATRHERLAAELENLDVDDSTGASGKGRHLRQHGRVDHARHNIAAAARRDLLDQVSGAR